MKTANQTGNFVIFVVIGIGMLLIGVVAVFLLTMGQKASIPVPLKTQPQGTAQPQATALPQSDAGTQPLSTSDEVTDIESDIKSVGADVQLVDEERSAVLGISTSL